MALDPRTEQDPGSCAKALNTPHTCTRRYTMGPNPAAASASAGGASAGGAGVGSTDTPELAPTQRIPLAAGGVGGA